MVLGLGGTMALHSGSMNSTVVLGGLVVWSGSVVLDCGCTMVLAVYHGNLGGIEAGCGHNVVGHGCSEV